MTENRAERTGGSVKESPVLSQSVRTQVDQINIKELILAVAAKWKIILLAALCGALLCGCYHQFFLKPSYEAYASIFITSNDSVISVSDMQLSSALTQDYSNILKSYTVLESVVEDLELDMDYRALASLVTITNPTDSHIIVITVTCGDKKLCMSIANSLLNIGVKRIYQVIGSSEPTVIDYSVAKSVKETTPALLEYAVKGAGLGSLLVCVLIVILFLADNTLKNEDDVIRYLRMPVLSSVPIFAEEAGKATESIPFHRTEVPYHADRPAKQQDEDKEIDKLFHSLLSETGTAGRGKRKTAIHMAVGEVPFAVSEAMNVLRGNIQFSGVDLKTIAVTSSLPNEGKSTVAFRLAKSMAGLEKRVLFIDCDIRNSDVCERYQVKGVGNGLSEYLCGRADKERIVCRTDDQYLDVIFTGASAPNPSELISGMLFTELISFVRSVYDYVILDTPPLNAVIDGVLIAKRCDGTVFVVESGVTDKGQVSKANRQMIYAGVRTLGAVLNKVKVHNHRYGYGYSRYYGYGKQKDEKKKER